MARSVDLMEGKQRRIEEVLAEPAFREQLMSLLKKSRRDYERFLAHFDTLDAVKEEELDADLSAKVERRVSAPRCISPQQPFKCATSIRFQTSLSSFSTYHPLMVEAHFSALLCTLMLGEFDALANVFERTAHPRSGGWKGYPVFLPPAVYGAGGIH